MREIPASLQTTYANLLQAHLNQPQFDFAGAPYTIERRGRLYWYVNQRGVGTSPPRQRYLGPDTDEMRARLEGMRSQKADMQSFRENCSRMVSQLRAGGAFGLDRQTGAAIRALVRSGVFRLGGTLVGTQAFRHYDMELGVVLAGDGAEDKQLRETHDLDIAAFDRLSNTIEDETDPDLAQTLIELGYKPKNTLNHKQPTSWRHANSTYDIDFLTPSFDEHERPAHLQSLNVWAQGLHFLNFLIADPMPAVSIYMEGLLVQVPRPERYAVHKLIISQRRHAGSGAKARKDLQQARAIIWAMSEDRPHEIHTAIAEADAKGDQWRKALDQALDLQILPGAPTRPGDSAEFTGKALGQPIRLRIAGTALQLLFGDDSLATATTHRGKLETIFRRHFRQRPAADILIRSYDLEGLT